MSRWIFSFTFPFAPFSLAFVAVDRRTSYDTVDLAGAPVVPLPPGLVFTRRLKTEPNSPAWKNGRTGPLSGYGVAPGRTLRFETLATKVLPGSLSILSNAVCERGTASTATPRNRGPSAR